MKISDEGLAFIESREGWRDKLPDGRYASYQDTFNGKLDKPTIGPGCTEGVTLGMVWTHEECHAAFRKELAKHEAAITRLVTVEISQHAFDALVSLSYNVGIGAVTNSTVLKKLNAGDNTGAAEAFKLYNKAGGAVVAGLVSRRAAEAAMFLKPDAEAPVSMPQTVTASAPPVTATQAAVVASTVVGSASQIPSLPDVSVLATLQTTASTVTDFATFLITNPMQTLVVLIVCGGLMYGPKLIGGTTS